MTQIILVRHGQTPWNKDKIFRGSKDIPLNDQGRRKPAWPGEWLQGERIDLLILRLFPDPGRQPKLSPNITV